MLALDVSVGLDNQIEQEVLVLDAVVLAEKYGTYILDSLAIFD
jgi:hypothetical protein